MRKHYLRLLTVCGVAAALAACDAGNRSAAEFESESEEARTLDPSLQTDRAIGTSGMQTGQAGQVGMDQSFGHFAAMTNKAEIELGRLAQERAQSAQVREYAGRLVEDHTKAQQALQDAAPSVPADPELDAMHKQTYDRLSQLSGAEFDREFMRTMVEGHRKAIERFEQEAGDGAPGTGVRGTTGQREGAAGQREGTAGQRPAAAAGEDLSQYAESTLPTLRNHLERAQQVQQQVQGQGQGQPR